MAGHFTSDTPGGNNIKVKVRLDFKGSARQGRFFFGGKPLEKVAEEIRDQNVAMYRNIPIQGVAIDHIDMGTEVYTMTDEVSGSEAAYAPVILDVSADYLEDVIKFIAREDFRKVEIMSPDTLTLNKSEIERMLFRMSEEIKNYKQVLERKYNMR